MKTNNSMQIKKMLFIFCLSLFFFGYSNAQFIPTTFQKKDNKPELPGMSDEEIQEYKRDMVQLTSSNLNGRVAGTHYELVAANYISKRFADIGLIAIDKNYQRKFSFSVGETISTESECIIDEQRLKIPDDARPLYYSLMESYENYYINGMNEYENIWVLPIFDNQNQLKLSIEEKDKLMYKKAKNAKDRGARAIIFYNNYTSDFVLPFNYTEGKFNNIGIPVFEISQKMYTSKIASLKKMSYIRLAPLISQNLKQGINVYGMINNGADKTIIISANYDGYVPLIDGKSVSNYPGANNNASGVAALFVLAKRLKKIKGNYNYLFIAYSGTNFNLSGSEKFLNDKNFFKDKIAFAIHLDKIGRYDIMNSITVNGIGTYAAWRGFFKDNEFDNMFILINKGEDENSDYVNYYTSRIPYLSFTTGVNHENGTSDDVHIKIHYPGVGYIIHKVFTITSQLDASKQNVVFTETKDNYDKKGDVKTVHPGVSLGITPDLNFKEGGLRIHKITKGQDAFNAGLKEGDVIILIRNFPIQNYDDYLQALSKFKKGDKVYIRVKRGNSVVQKLVVFS